MCHIRSIFFLIMALYICDIPYHLKELLKQQNGDFFVDIKAYRQIGQSTDNAVCIDMDLLQVGSEPIGMRCPYCQEDIMTKAHYKNTTLTHTVALLLAIFFWWLCCCIIPYVTKRWRNVEHHCPNCHRYLGVYSRSTNM